MSSEIYLTLSRIISFLGFLVNLTLHVSLTYITLYKVKKIDFGYKLLVLVFTELCMVLSLIGMLIHPFYHTYNAGLIAFNTVSYRIIPKFLINIAMAAYSGVCLAIISFFSILFAFRFWTMTNSHWALRFKNWKSLTLTPYAALVGVLSTYSFIHFGSIDKVAEDYFREALAENYNVTIENVTGNAIIAFMPNATGKWYQRIHWNSYLLTHFIISTMTFQFIVVAYCGARMHYKMSDMIESLSPASRRLQTQFFKCLILQITPPILTIFLPTLVILCIPYLNLQIDFPTGIVVVLFNLYPVFDSCIMIVIISEYRTAMRNLFEKLVMSPLDWLTRDREAAQRNDIQLQTFASLE